MNVLSRRLSYKNKHAAKNPNNATALPATTFGGAWLVPPVPCWKLEVPLPEPELDELPLLLPEDDDDDPVPLFPALPPPEIPGTVFGVFVELAALADALAPTVGSSPVAKNESKIVLLFPMATVLLVPAVLV